MENDTAKLTNNEEGLFLELPRQDGIGVVFLLTQPFDPEIISTACGVLVSDALLSEAEAIRQANIEASVRLKETQMTHPLLGVTENF